MSLWVKPGTAAAGSVGGGLGTWGRVAGRSRCWDRPHNAGSGATRRGRLHSWVTAMATATGLLHAGHPGEPPAPSPQRALQIMLRVVELVGRGHTATGFRAGVQTQLCPRARAPTHSTLTPRGDKEAPGFQTSDCRPAPWLLYGLFTCERQQEPLGSQGVA